MEAPAKNLIKDEALHPVKTYHPEEWPEAGLPRGGAPPPGSSRQLSSDF
ncbi:hypothetical protein J7L60_05635 [Candidatus Bathyarchaeota archaeon]|nr:hypothetical protein [Candidatus Bathyarchaeota archaeon]